MQPVRDAPDSASQVPSSLRRVCCDGSLTATTPDFTTEWHGGAWNLHRLPVNPQHWLERAGHQKALRVQDPVENPCRKANKRCAGRPALNGLLWSGSRPGSISSDPKWEHIIPP